MRPPAVLLGIATVITASCGEGEGDRGSGAADPPPTTAVAPTGRSGALRVQEYPVRSGSRPHDVAPAPDGTVWYTAQGSGELGRLDPATGTTTTVPLGEGSEPHGVIVGPTPHRG